jgi:hypothetical protein
MGLVYSRRSIAKKGSLQGKENFGRQIFNPDVAVESKDGRCLSVPIIIGTDLVFVRFSYQNKIC